MDLPRLVALTPGDLPAAPRAAAFLRGLERALAAGLPGILVREPRLSDRACHELLVEVRTRCDAAGGRWLAVHDRAHLARGLRLPALHLGFRSLAPALLRPWIGSGIQLGLSTHAHDDPATWRGADYLFHGPLRETPSKDARAVPVGFEGLTHACGKTGLPILALGGVRPEDVGAALAAGCWGVAALSGILAARDPGAATEAYLAALESAH